MQKVIIFLYLILLSFFSYSQDNKPITVKKGTSLLDYFPPSERYLYPDFTAGNVIYKTNTYTGIRLNYNYLTGEIEFLKNRDTLTIIDKKNLELITVAGDSLYYDNGYILLIKNRHPKIGVKETIKFKDYMKKDGMGSASSAGSISSYSSIPSGGQLQKLEADQDLIFRRTKVFYILSADGDFVLFIKKNVLKLFPKNKDQIKSFLKSNKIKFDSEEDLLKLADFLETL